jgi:LysM repeat protein
MKANPRGPAGIPLAAVLAVFLAMALAGCDPARPQVLLTRGTPEATPTSARLLAPSATPSAAPVAITPLVLNPSTTSTETRVATATHLPSATPVTPSPTMSPTVSPTKKPTLAPTPAPTSTPTVAATATPQVRIHVVRAGETLAIIARKYATTATAIAKYNNISNPNRIYVGQRLLIP